MEGVGLEELRLLTANSCIAVVISKVILAWLRDVFILLGGVGWAAAAIAERVTSRCLAPIATCRQGVREFWCASHRSIIDSSAGSS